jgi:hypothetical protein
VVVLVAITAAVDLVDTAEEDTVSWDPAGIMAVLVVDTAASWEPVMADLVADTPVLVAEAS